MLPFRIPLRDWISEGVDVLIERYSVLFDTFSAAVFFMVDGLRDVFMAGHPAILMVVFVVLTLWLAGWKPSVVAALGLLLTENMGLWPAFVETLALVLTAEVLVILCGLPLGILAAGSDRVDTVLRPVLDFMQTMPAFVYLIPAVMFFGLGLVPGVMATFVFAIPPLTRLTNLGIRQVPEDLIEAADAFGATRLQKLVKVQVPSALPTIMAGVNQSIMLGLSMVVIAAMIGAGGLGEDVLRGIQRIQIGRGFEAGLAVVILAIILDRITAGLGERRGPPVGTA